LTTYILRRLIQAFIVLIIVTIVVFFAMRFMPGDPIYMIISQGNLSNVTQQQIDEIRHQYGLDRPVIIQYFSWVGDLFHGNFGKSLNQGSSTGALIKQGYL